MLPAMLTEGKTVSIKNKSLKEDKDSAEKHYYPSVATAKRKL